MGFYVGETTMVGREFFGGVGFSELSDELCGRCTCVCMCAAGEFLSPLSRNQLEIFDQVRKMAKNYIKHR
jgi:hypothetical protein